MAAAAVVPQAPAVAPGAAAPGSGLPYPVRPDASPIYPGLASYMGLELTQEVILANMPEYAHVNAGTMAQVGKKNNFATNMFLCMVQHFKTPF